MNKGAIEFWESALLQDSTNKCIFHMILPTIMTTKQPYWDSIKNRIDQNDDRVIQAQRENLMCTYCKKDVQGQSIRLAIRIVLSSDNKCGFGTVAICSSCSNVNMLSFDSDTPMHDVMFNRLEMVGREVVFNNLHKKIDGLEFMHQLMEGFHTNYPSFIRQLRKIEAKKCYYCKKSPSRKLLYCSKCCYVRYCDQTCQHADWKQHKNECKFLTTQSIFFDYRKHGKRYK